MVQSTPAHSSIALRTLACATAVLAFLLASAPAAAGTVNLAWDAVPSALVAGYVVHYGPAAGSYTASVDVGKVTTATVNGLTEGATYHFTVAAYDAAHNEGSLSNDVAGTVKYTVPVASFSASTVSGPAPLALNFINSSTGAITSYSWTFGDGTTSTVQSPAKVYSSAGTFTVALKVTGPGGTNTLTKANYITVTTGGLDTTPPAAPASLTASASGSTSINLSWPAATDNVGVTGYGIERCLGASCSTFAQIATSTGTSYANAGLAAGTTYRYRVRATDAAGNLGAYSPIATATTASAPDTTPPAAPASLTATASGSSSINLSWPAATDNVGVTGYRVERCLGASCATFAQLATSTGTSYADAGLAPGTTYRYRVRATDAAGNLGAYSPIATATTASATTGLVASYSFSEGAGTTTADASGGGRTGTLLGGPSWTGGKYGTGLSFNGSSTYVDLGTSAALGLTGSMTVSAWVFETANVGDDGQIVAKSDSGSGWQLKSTPDTGARTFGVAITNASGGRVQRYSNATRALNTWYHVAGVYDATAQTLNIYVNGVLSNGTLSGAVPSSQRASSVAANIGRRSGGFYIKGTIDNVRIYSRALSAAEIQADMAKP